MCETFDRPGYGDPALIVVPLAQSHWAKMIAKGSAIVAFKNAPEHLVVYYEGNLYRASNLHRFEDRASVAYGRLTQRAPTVAMAIAYSSVKAPAIPIQRRHLFRFKPASYSSSKPPSSRECTDSSIQPDSHAVVAPVRLTTRSDVMVKMDGVITYQEGVSL